MQISVSMMTEYLTGIMLYHSLLNPLIIILLSRNIRQILFNWCPGLFRTLLKYHYMHRLSSKRTSSTNIWHPISTAATKSLQSTSNPANHCCLWGRSIIISATTQSSYNVVCLAEAYFSNCMLSALSLFSISSFGWNNRLAAITKIVLTTVYYLDQSKNNVKNCCMENNFPVARIACYLNEVCLGFYAHLKQ